MHERHWMKTEILDGFMKQIVAPPRTYSEESLKGLGIDPNLMLFMSRPDFSDNAHALWEYVGKTTNYKTGWLLLNKEHSAKMTGKGIMNALWNSPEGRSLARSARYFIQTTNDARVEKNPGQIFVNVWHGTGVKATDFLSFKNDDPHLLRLKSAADCTDLFLVHSVVDKINMAAEFSCDARRFVPTGQPRLDRVKIADGKSNIKRLFGGVLAEYEKLILYAPTSRITSFSKVGDSFTGNAFNLPCFHEEKLDAALARQNAALVVKLHPIDENKYTRADLQLGGRGYLLTDDDLFFADLQMNDVLNAFDVMIGDYTSMITDFLPLDRPIVYVLGDLGEYAEKEGFSHNDVDFYMPGEKVGTFDGLLAALDDVFERPERHSEWRRTVLRQKSTFMDGSACERALKAIENWKPLTNYEEMFFAQKTLYPVAQEYEKALEELDERLWNSENRVREASKLLKVIEDANPVVSAALAALNAPSISRAESTENEKKAGLEALCDHILEGYPGEYVFYSVRQNRDWTGKTRTMLQQLAAKIADAGCLFLLGTVEQRDEKKSTGERPEAVPINERLIALRDCFHTECVLDRIRRHGKKAILVVPSDFHDGNDALVELGASKAHRVAYLYRYHIKDYRGKKNPSPYDVARWEALRCAAGNRRVRFLACTEALRELAIQEAGAHDVHVMTPGADCAMFARLDRAAIPERLRMLKASGKPLVGYCGTIDNRLYYSIIHYACGRMKDCEFVFAGANRISGTWGHTFTDYPNIHLLEEADYMDAPAIIHAFDAAIIPYFKSARERVPSKLFEYFACGKPVVTTNMVIAEQYDGIFMGESHGDFVNALNAALDRKDDAGLRACSVTVAEENDWSRKAREFLDFMEL